jgi:hypothetical protein
MQAMNFINQIRNPQQFLQGMGIPQEFIKSPDDAAQYLLQNGKVTQQQIDQAKQMFKR